MDCTIPSHNVRTFCSAISSMSKIGKDLYVEFDPLDQGLILRAINDAKSVFSSFTFRPGFFERCRIPSAGKRKRERRRRQQQHSQDAADDDNIMEDNEDEDDDEDLYKCRVPLRALQAVTKSRRGVVSLRLRDEVSADHLFLSFEFRIESRDGNTSHIQHKIGVVEADGVQAVTDQDGASELLADPRKLLQMMEPLKKTNEVALVVNDEAKIITMASFHHSSAVSEENNILLQTKSATLLKTETSVVADEFEVFQFVDYRDTDDAEEDIPSNVNSEVTMIFSLREPKAMLHFCQSADENLRVNISFHWGGKPIVFEANTPYFSGKLVMATLDFSLLQGAKISTNNSIHSSNRKDNNARNNDDNHTEE